MNGHNANEFQMEVRRGSASQISSASDAPSGQSGTVLEEGEELHIPGGGAMAGLGETGDICEQCQEPLTIAEPVVNFQGRLWHPSCFV